MSVCSATAAATRPGARRESRSSSSRASTTEAQFFIDKTGSKGIDQRKYSTISTHKSSSSANLCCVVSILIAVIAIGWFESSMDFIG
ncbi:hypothetical protein ACF0H5_004458 [Mactra antiquata]